MTNYDLFNGDADGICALTQLRNATPLESVLITGVKRDIQLLGQVEAAAGDKVTVLDISLDKNRTDLERVLEQGAEVFYVDHHFAGDIPESGNLTAMINTAPDTCTSILVNTHLKGQFVLWAIVGAFGDNLKNSALALAKPLALSEQQTTLLENLGIYINYNGYGPSIEDLHFAPAELYQKVVPYSTPFEFVENESEVFEKLEQGYQSDMASAQSTKPIQPSDATRVYMLPNEAWARRVSGVFGNDLANESPDCAHAVITEKENGNYLVSVRAPLNNKTGADEICRSFPTGGGRKAAAGINDLDKQNLDNFIQQFDQFYQSAQVSNF